MRFFLDSGSADEARRIKDLGLLDGVWLSLDAAEEAGSEYRKAIRDLASLTDGPVLVELSAGDTKGMYKEARELAKLGKDVIVRVPLAPEGMRVARLLAQDQVAICADGCYSAAQALIAAKANLAYVAPAVGPLDDVGTIGMDLVEQVIRIYDNFGYQTQIVVAEAKNPIHVLDAAVMGADVAVSAGSRDRAAFSPPAFGREHRRAEAVVKLSADRILYLARVVLKSLKDNRNLEQKSDDETVRRAVVRELTDTFKELDAMEEKVRASLAKRRISEQDREFQFSRSLEEELRKHGA